MTFGYCRANRIICVPLIRQTYVFLYQVHFSALNSFSYSIIVRFEQGTADEVKSICRKVHGSSTMGRCRDIFILESAVAVVSDAISLTIDVDGRFFALILSFFLSPIEVSIIK